MCLNTCVEGILKQAGQHIIAGIYEEARDYRLFHTDAFNNQL